MSNFDAALLGKRYIGCGQSDGLIELHQVPGNALGAYMNGAEITVYTNAQDATGDTMNSGCITIHGNTGDAPGYAMRGGAIYVKGNAGYRAGIHMKEYQDKIPALVVGGACGSFLGEYQAGGLIVVLGIGYENTVCVGNFCGTGMHGGAIYLRTKTLPVDLPTQVLASEATPEDMARIIPHVKTFCEKFGYDAQALLSDTFYVLRSNTKNPYQQLYVHN